MKDKAILVSVIIPCRNEKDYISRCLDSIAAQDFPKENLEVLVVDGFSEDKTREIVKKYAEKYPFIKLLNNPKKYIPFALNIGIKESRGEVIIRMDAHASYESSYIRKCLENLRSGKVDNVGGIIKTLAPKKSLTSKTIALVLSHPFGVGNSYFRAGSKKPRLVDTVFGGCYKKEVFEKIGLFDERLIRSQDIEFNKRLRNAGGKILLVPDIIAYYYPSASFLNFFNHNFKDGFWTIYPLKFGVRIFSFRHLIPLFFVLTLGWSIWPYLLISLFFSFKLALREKDVRLFFLMPIAFFCRHFGYGLGSLWGLIKLLF